jgi:hypothetical protein
MASERVPEMLPSDSISYGGKTWKREEVDRNTFQWVRELEDDEYDWDPETDGVTLVGTEMPIRVVSLQKLDDQWHVEAAETAGPEYHRPGFTEPISSDYSYSSTDLERAADRVRAFIEQLSQETGQQGSNTGTD